MKSEHLTRGPALLCALGALIAASCGTSRDTADASTPVGGGGGVEPPVVGNPTDMDEPSAGVPTDGEDETPGDLPLDGEDTPTGGEPAAQNPPPGDEPPLAGGTGFAHVENLDRGVVAVASGAGVYVGWRMFGYEYRRDDPERIAYNLYRDEQLVATVTDSTNYLDAAGTASSTYAVAAVADGVEGERSTPVAAWAENFLRVPLQSPGEIYGAHDASLGDLDGDGQYEIIMLWQPSDARDNSQSGITSNVFIDALRLDGTRLWRLDLGPNLRAGEHYNQFVVIDADGDGRSELGLKTAPGTRDGTGAFLSLGPAAADDDSQVFRSGTGYVLNGPEYFTVFEGLTGRELATAAYHVQRGQVGAWGDDYGNRVDRFLAAAAYLDDTGLPSFLMARGLRLRIWRDWSPRIAAMRSAPI